jgi:putative oxidoreductase
MGNGNILAPLQTRGASVGLFFVRIVVGLAFAFHGWPKILNPTGWMTHPTLTVPWSGIAVPIPPELQATVAVVEFFGGILLIIGLLVRLAGLALCADMIVAFALVELPHGTPFVGGGHTLEPNLTYMVVSFMLLLSGPGAISLDSVLFGPRPAVGITPQNVRRVA